MRRGLPPGWEATLALWHGRPIAAIVPVGHGAAAAALVDGALAFAPFDYEAALPAEMLSEYRALRSPFAQTGSPALPQGLNLGAHLFWMDRVHADAMAAATLVPWAQYWAWWLSGVAVSEVTSLGCHTDLWDPARGEFSGLAIAQGWAARFAPVVPAGQAIGTLRPDLAARTGLSPAIRVLAGIHDSNAALHAARGFPKIGSTSATVLSTGTWFIAMRPTSGILPALPEARDCLVNVDCLGQPVPSARFMGGREIESLIEIDTRRVDIRPDQPHLIDAVPRVLAAGAMHLPTLAPGCGPFPDRAGHWVNAPDDWYERRAAACLYGLALVAAGCARTSLTLELALAAAGAFAAIYHPVGTAMLVEAAGDRPGRALGTNGVCGNAGVALAPVITGVLASRFGWPVAFAVPGALFMLLGVAWLWLPVTGLVGSGTAQPFTAIPRAVVRRAVIVLLLLAAVSGLVFNAFTMLIPKLMQERLDGQALPLIGLMAFAATLCGALTQFTIGRLIEPHHTEAPCFCHSACCWCPPCCR